ncbi:MAG: uracil-DNA glycosylase [Ottowia sp.]|nr:uracil-DNA glycosylase [Ottowia sp.]
MKLDARQRAMLAEMGIWLPAPPAAKAAPHPAPPPRRAAPLRTQPPADPSPAPATLLAPDTEARAARIAQLDWDALCAEAQQCRACNLCQQRKNVVFEAGSRAAHWLIVGEAPGEQEDIQGAPFVGPAGQLLDAMLAALHLSRENNKTHKTVYIANVLKCRPPGNRNPLPEEVALCAPFLQRQMALLTPRVILALGRFAAQSLLQTNESIGRLRGRVHDWRGTPLIVSYHPAYLLRSPHAKAHAWHDLCLALQAAQERGAEVAS